MPIEKSNYTKKKYECYGLKSYCPKCNEVIDETEFMQNEGLCVNCYEREQNLIQKKNH